MLRICPAYDKVKLTEIDDLRKKSSRPFINLSIFERLKASTEAYWNAFQSNWKKDTGPCIHPLSQASVCHGQEPKLFKRNNVCICSTYADHILIIYLTDYVYRLSIE